ncbi:hypothetical protein KUCAC02_001269, partial [Chaenocephalus aceratus]
NDLLLVSLKWDWGTLRIPQSQQASRTHTTSLTRSKHAHKQAQVHVCGLKHAPFEVQSARKSNCTGRVELPETIGSSGPRVLALAFDNCIEPTHWLADSRVPGTCQLHHMRPRAPGTFSSSLFSGAVTRKRRREGRGDSAGIAATCSR